MLQRFLPSLKIVLLLLASATPARSAENNLSAPLDVSGRGALPSNDTAPGATWKDSPFSPLDFSLRAGLASDYIYRGNDPVRSHQPVVGAAVEASFSLLYAGATVGSVKLPTNPAAELTFNGGIRPKIWDIDFDFGWTYLQYPGEAEGASTDYWETFARGNYKLTDAVSIAAGFAYSPSVSNTGAWSKYAATGLSVELRRDLLPNDIGVSLSGVVGYFWFGNQVPALGGFPLPAYTHWNAGVTFSRKMFNLDLRYSNTNLSKEDCFASRATPVPCRAAASTPSIIPTGWSRTGAVPPWWRSYGLR